MRFKQPITNITEAPDSQSTTISQGLYGEPAEILGTRSGVSRIRLARDNYEGYVPTDSLIEVTDPSTHFVAERATLLFHEPDIKRSVGVRIVFGSELVIAQEMDEKFLQTQDGLYALKDHCLRIKQRLDADLAGVAERFFLGAPYLWGGRSPDGFDCSGLVQMAAFSTGVSLPRDSGQQEAFLTDDTLPGSEVELDRMQRSDLVYWPGHTGILLDAATLLHATAHTMISGIEPLSAVVERAGEISTVRRL